MRALHRRRSSTDGGIGPPPAISAVSPLGVTPAVPVAQRGLLLLLSVVNRPSGVPLAALGGVVGLLVEY